MTFRSNPPDISPRSPTPAASAARTPLTAEQIAMIEEALTCLGEFGELRLVVEKGRLRFIVTQKSYDALKWVPGSIEKNGDR